MALEFSISLHDVAPETWPECRELLALVDALDAPLSLLVVPHYHGGVRVDADPRFANAMRTRLVRGDEIVLHGYYHDDDDGPPPRAPLDWVRRRVVTAGEGEFGALDGASAARLIARGRAVLGTIGISPVGFTAPAWLMSAASLAALTASGLPYAATRDALIDLKRHTEVPAPSLVYSTRSRWRRAVSQRWNAHRATALADAPRLRIALHPSDARYAAVLRDWRRLLERIANDRTAVLESRWLGQSAPH